MPLYDFTCGVHEFERLVPMGTEAVSCRCGEVATRSKVPVGFAYTHGYPTDFKPGPDFYRLNSEAQAAKVEAREVLQKEGITHG